MGSSFASVVSRYNTFGEQRYELETVCLTSFGKQRALQVAEACDFLGDCLRVAKAIDDGKFKDIENWSTEMRTKRESMK
jgi:hypothetical protein